MNTTWVRALVGSQVPASRFSSAVASALAKAPNHERPGPAEHDFDRAVRLTPTGSPDMSLADLPASWSVHGGPMNGGITLAVAANALSARLNQLHGHPDPLCVSAFFLAAADSGPAQVRTEVTRGSRSMSTATASIFQPDATGTPLERLRGTGTFADLGAAPPHVLTVARPPHLPAPESASPPTPCPPPLWMTQQ